MACGDEHVGLARATEKGREVWCTGTYAGPCGGDAGIRQRGHDAGSALEEVGDIIRVRHTCRTAGLHRGADDKLVAAWHHVDRTGAQCGGGVVCPTLNRQHLAAISVDLIQRRVPVCQAELLAVFGHFQLAALPAGCDQNEIMAFHIQRVVV